MEYNTRYSKKSLIQIYLLQKQIDELDKENKILKDKLKELEQDNTIKKNEQQMTTHYFYPHKKKIKTAIENPNQYID